MWSLLALYFVQTFSPYCLLSRLKVEASELLALTVEVQKDEDLALIAAEQVDTIHQRWLLLSSKTYSEILLSSGKSGNRTFEQTES